MKKNPEGYENCWEYWDCSPDMQKECIVYKERDGKECLFYTDNLKVFDWAREKRNFNSCLECPWCEHLVRQQPKNRQE
jgi:hypothetical protein